MNTRLYRPSGKSEPGALGQMLMLTAAVGLVTGAVMGALEFYLFSLFMVFPAVLGAAVGGVASARIDRGKIRAPVAAGLVAFVAAGLGQITTHGVHYLAWRNANEEDIRVRIVQAAGAGELNEEELAQLQALDPAVMLDGSLEEEYGASGILGYLRWKADTGISVERAGSSSGEGSGPSFQGPLAYGLWAFEILLAGFVGLGMAYSRARKPFCEVCKHWYDRVEVVAVGSGQKDAVQAVTRALGVRDFGQILNPEVLGEPGDKLSSLMLLDRCSHCEEHEPIFTYRVLKVSGNKVKTKDHYRSMLSGDESRLVIEAAKRLAKESEAASQAAVEQSGTTDDGGFLEP